MFAKSEIYLADNLIISYLDNKKDSDKILLFVHGWGADKYNLQIIYQALANQYRIIAIDLPGFGESLRPNYTWNSIDYAQLILQFLDKLNIQTCSYIGHSFGGKIGIILASQQKDRIKHLILIDSSGLRPKRGINWYLQVYSFKFLKFLFQKMIKSEKQWQKIQQNFGSSDYQNADAIRDILVTVVNEDYSHLLPEIQCPVFLYWGEKDQDTPLWMAKKMHKLIKDSGLYIVKKGSHFSFLEDQRIISIIDSLVSQ
ncbi:MAG: alpha/beta hydrolase [Spirochaetes bacterium]|nr:alpha/beta hydrolase [Spirochaetota bacterium]